MENQTYTIQSPIYLLKNSYEKMKSEFENLSEEKSNLQTLMKYHTTKSEQNLTTQKEHYEFIIKDLNKTIENLEARCRVLEVEQNEKNRKQIRRYVQTINQKEVQINSLKRQITSLKTKITSQQQEINNLNNTKQNYEIFVFKGIDQIKLHIKQTAAQFQDLQTEKMLLASKFRQHNQKIVLIENQIYGLESKKNILEQNYQNLKILHKKARDQYIDLKFQISRLKECASFNNEYPNCFRAQKEEFLDLSKELQKVIEVNQVIERCQSLLSQTNKFSQINRQLINENTLLKEKVANYGFQIDELRCKYESGYEDEYLKNKQPSVYDYLLQKKKKFQQFQQTIEKIQNYIEAKDCNINEILRLMMQKELKCNCGKDEELNDLKKQLQSLHCKLDSWTDAVQKCKKEKVEIEQKIELYRQEIRNMIKANGKKGKKIVIRCDTCLLQVQKNQKSEVCQDCKKVLHAEKCSLEHHCGSFTYEDSISVSQSNFFA